MAYAPVEETSFNNAQNPSSTGNIVPLMQSWVSGAQPNHGLLLRQPLFGTAYTQFQSSESPTVAQRPRLDVCFTVTCAAGFADCNHNGADGSEASITTPASCGACGATCALANAAPACVAGSCGIAFCNAGFGDCDGKAAIGCETSLAAATDCGCCGIACVAGSPTAESCDGIDNDCDGAIDNGNPGGGAACSTGQSGVCSAGTTACTGGALMNGTWQYTPVTNGTSCGASRWPACTGAASRSASGTAPMATPAGAPRIVAVRPGWSTGARRTDRTIPEPSGGQVQ